LFGCGGTGTPTTPPTGGGGGGGDAGTPTPAPTATISISNFTYSPADLVVAPGTVVTVINYDSIIHSVTSESVVGANTPGAVNGVSFDTGSFTGQASFTIPSNA